MSIKIFNLETKSIDNVDLDIDTLVDYVNGSKTKCILYTPWSYYDVEDGSRHILVKIDNRTRNIESFLPENASDLWYGISSPADIKTCRIRNIIPNIRYRFNVRASVSKFMFSHTSEGLNLVESNLPIINTLRSTVYENNRFPRKILMWEFIRADEILDKKVVKINFITKTLEDVTEEDAILLNEMVELGEGSEKFREHFKQISGYSSDGTDKPSNEFDFVSTSESDVPIRSEKYDDNFILVKNKILCNNSIAMGVDSRKSVNSIIMGKFISRKIMVFKHTGLIPCFSIINFRNMFGFYPIWYIHPDVTLYSSDVMDGLLSLLDLIDSENVYDDEEEVKNVWKYFVPYYMADDWEEYAELVAKDKAKLSGYDKPASIDLIDEKDFIEYMLVHKFTERPRQLTSRTASFDYYSKLYFEPGRTPEDYDRAVNGYRCNLYVFEENGELYLRDCINLCTIRIANLEDDYRGNFFRKICNILVKSKLVFHRLSPVLYVCDLGEYIVKMSQIGVVALEKKDNGSFLFDTPPVVSDDLFYRVQVKRYDCHTRTDRDYKINYVQESLPPLVEKALYRSKGLDGFVDPTDRELELFGTRRNPNFDTDYDKRLADRWQDIREVYNIFLGSNLMQWATAGARGDSSNSAFLRESDWDRVIWYCPFNTWFASIEMAETKFDWTGKHNLSVTFNNRYNYEYYYKVNDFYIRGDVCLIRCNIPSKKWRLIADSYPIQYVDLSDLGLSAGISNSINEEGRGTGIFALAIDDSEILFRSKEFLIVDTDGHRYLIGARNQDGINVVENPIISELDVTLLKLIENMEDKTYVNGIWKLLHYGDFTNISRVQTNLYYVENKRLLYSKRYTKDDFENPKTISDRYYVFVDTILYVFKSEEKVISIFRLDDSSLSVNDKLYTWSSQYNLFVPDKRYISVEVREEKSDMIVNTVSEVEETNTTNDFSTTSIFDKSNEYKTIEKEESSKDDWLYNFNEDYFDHE